MNAPEIFHLFRDEMLKNELLYVSLKGNDSLPFLIYGLK